MLEFCAKCDVRNVKWNCKTNLTDLRQLRISALDGGGMALLIAASPVGRSPVSKKTLFRLKGEDVAVLVHCSQRFVSKHLLPLNFLPRFHLFHVWHLTRMSLSASCLVSCPKLSITLLRSTFHLIASSIYLLLSFQSFSGMLHPLNYCSPVFRRWQLTHMKNWRQENVEGQK